ncbi:MAG TPA: saccharopine dehydrogenase NADP-binding domain-containing protein [Polyangiaceae bacterium]|nr:saccharopine dehydrogenase NADP-binding domain-containing protein [Polyangiaceae bacterium]
MVQGPQARALEVCASVASACNEAPSQSASAKRCDDNVHTVRVDLSVPAHVAECVKDVDLVIGAVPGWLDLAVLRTVIAHRKPFADISFMPEGASRLSPSAAEAGVVGVVDCGVTPGMSNEEYTHAARVVEGGKLVVKTASARSNTSSSKASGPSRPSTPTASARSPTRSRSPT